MMSSSGNLIRLLLRTPAAAAAKVADKETERRGEDAEAWDTGIGHAGQLNLQKQGHQGETPLCRPRGGRRAPDKMSRSNGGSGSPAQKKWAGRRTPPAASPFAKGWTVGEVVGVARRHPVPCAFALSLLFFMGVEYTLRMVPSNSPPFDVGFVLTKPLHRLLTGHPALNSALAALNTVFVGMQAAYILWTLLLEGRPRATISALFMFTCRGILGYSTQLPLPQDFLGSGVDFPVGNVSFFLFFSGHVAGSVIASLDMRRTGRRGLAGLFDGLNLLQGLRLLATRGHYTIDLATGVGAGFLFDVLAGKYEESRAEAAAPVAGAAEEEAQMRGCHGCCACTCHG